MKALEERNVRRYVRRNKKVLGEPTPEQIAQGVGWYDEVTQYAYGLADEYDTTLEVVAGIIAAFSPRQSWKRNKELTELFLQGKPTPGLGQSRVNANAVMRQGIPALHGPKTNAFARNIAGDTDAVTIDTHMVRAAGIDGREAPTPKQYREMVAAVRRLARRWKMQPRDMQALIWIMQRGRAE